MKSKRFAQYVCASILATGFGLNILNALSGYGISEGTTSITAEGGSMHIWTRDISTIGKKGECMPLENGFYSSIEECETDFDTNCKG